MSEGMPNTTPLRLLVADDQAIIRRGLALMLDAEPDIEVVGQAADGQEALEMAEALRPDVVVMDLQMPRLSGVAATRLLAGRLPRTRVVVLTTFDDDERVFEAVQAGAHAYLLKDAAEDEVLDTVRAVHRGESRLAPSVARKVLDQFRALYAYSPYHHVEDGTAYPAILFMTGENDPRVDPRESRKMTARLQAATSSPAPILLRTSANAGHGGDNSLSERIEQSVDVYAFLFEQLGVGVGNSAHRD